MSMIGLSQDPAVPLEEIMLEAERIGQDRQKNAQINRELHNEKKLTLLDQKIGKLQERHDKLGTAALFGFAMNLVSNLIQKLDLLIPGLGSALQVAAQGAGQGNPWQREASQAEIDSVRLQTLAEGENRLFEREDEILKDQQESLQTLQHRMERALEDLQDTRQALVRP